MCTTCRYNRLSSADGFHPAAAVFLQVDPLVSLMKVEKVPDSTYDMIGGLEKQIREIKEVRSLYGSVLMLFFIAMHTRTSMMFTCLPLYVH